MSETIKVTLQLPVEVHDDGDGQHIARVPGKGDIVGMGGSAKDAKHQAAEKAAQIISELLSNGDLGSTKGDGQQAQTQDAQGIADRLSQAAMEILRNRNDADAQTHAALRGAFVDALNNPQF